MRPWWVIPALVVVLSLGACKGKVTDDDVASDDDAMDDDVVDDDSGDDDSCGETAMDQGLYHRAEALECPAERDPVVEVPEDCTNGMHGECSSHADCTDGPNGRCTMGLWYQDDCQCSYDECFSDEDCEDAEICGCAESTPFELYPNNICLGVRCKTDAECETGLCMASPWTCDGAQEGETTFFVSSFYCATPEDECRNHETCMCADPDARCHWGPDEDHWICSKWFWADCD